MIDAAALRSRVDLLDLIRRDTALKQVATVSGRGPEYAGSCPWCGGRDRFRCQPQMGVWYCRGCSEKWGDAIDYVRRRDAIGFVEAVAVLAGQPADLPPRPPPSRPLAAATGPTAEWRAAAEQTVAAAIATLWSDQGAQARAYLHQRGLRDETIWDRELGLLAPGTPQRGVTIPWRRSGVLDHVNVRRSIAEPRYKALAGGSPVLFGTDDLAGQTVVVLVEGELDCCLLAQAGGDLAGVASLGSASKGVSTQAMPYLLAARRIVLAYDTDKPGQQGAAKLADLYGRMRPIVVPGDGDVTDYWRSGGDLRSWLAGALTALDAPAESLLDRAARLLRQVDGWPLDEARELFTGFSDDELRDAITTLEGAK